MLKQILLLVALSFSICSAQLSSFTAAKSTFIQTDTLHIARYNHAMVVLQNGNILISGGVGNGAEKSCEIYDLQTHKWRITASMNNHRENHKMFLLKNNKVISIGGVENRSCEIFDPETETWTYTDSIPTFRFLWEATLQLRDGSIIITGGLRLLYNGSPALALRDCELYNPETGKWKNIALLNEARYSHSITELNNGKIIATGGVGVDGSQLKSCEIYDPVQDTWTSVAYMNIQRDSHASYKLTNGTVFVAGGNLDAYSTYFSQRSCEVYNSEANSWMITDSLLSGWSNHEIYLVNNIGQLILFAGLRWEAYDPINLKSLYEGIGPEYKMYDHNSIQMKDERVMLVGGEDVSFSSGMPYRKPSNECYIFTFDGYTAVEKTDEVPKGFQLFQNYPNPFNPSTKIKFSVPKASRVSLTVFDMLGRAITKLIDNEEKNAGVYEADFNAAGLSSGVYFCKLTVGNKIAVNKMLLTK